MPLDIGGFGYKSKKVCQKSSFAFYQAVRDLLPVWALEDMRKMEVFHWEDDRRACAYTPSEALLYALVHDHQPYARYLLNRYSVGALEMPSRSFCCCQSSNTPHLAMAVRYNRTNILKMILDSAKSFSEKERRNYVNSQSCVHAEGGKTALHIACDLVRPECVMLLLGSAACPYVTDQQGDTPLDSLLRQVHQSSAGARTKHVCLGYLILFMRELFRFQMRRELRENPRPWRALLGEQAFQWLSGSAPPSLFVLATRTLMTSVPGEQLDSLPLPDFLKPLDFRLR
ncbi:ankyrin repeat domain-containing protein 9 [Scleropages formosus]|nr:ankyrin repeat domain-containing protein 9 [Scleropages formosus]